MHRWVRYEAPVMVCVDLDDGTATGMVIDVVLGDEHEDLKLARDHRGSLLVYDAMMNPVASSEQRALRAIAIAESRDWPNRLDWNQGPDVLRYPTTTTSSPT